METQVPRRLVTRQVARQRVGGISCTTEYRLLTKDPTWPRPRQITPGISGYYEDELDRWIEARQETSKRGSDQT
jgi:predicted DNA-binding transcriptional regulator AlpA